MIKTISNKKAIRKIAKLEIAIVKAFAELDIADNSRIGLQESIDSAQAILRKEYGYKLDNDSLAYIERSNWKAEANDN